MVRFHVETIADRRHVATIANPTMLMSAQTTSRWLLKASVHPVPLGRSAGIVIGESTPES